MQQPEQKVYHPAMTEQQMGIIAQFFNLPFTGTRKENAMILQETNAILGEFGRVLEECKQPPAPTPTEQPVKTPGGRPLAKDDPLLTKHQSEGE